ncbi:MAG: TauD/TfdA family dioxygenase [Alphaproteobacteria bacterium]|nr:TauD/TfdA family dioxygenase [Alphaproteobacteria bacterium]
MLNIEKLHPDFGARIMGLNLNTDLTPGVVSEIKSAIDDHSFLCFPDQEFDDDRQVAFTRMFGEPEPDHVALGQEGRVEYLGTIGNIDADGNQRGNADRKTVFSTGNNMWHSDSSFREVPTFISLMAAYEVPAEDGHTQFASGRSAYARLTGEEKQRVDDLIVIHNYVFSRSKVAPDAVTPSHAASLPPVEQKLVRTNPGNGAKNYYVGSHAERVVGRTDAESRELLDGLLEAMTRKEDIYSHAWQPGEVAIWDNRCLLHRGTGFDADKYRRYMRQTRVIGDGSSLTEYGGR